MCITLTDQLGQTIHLSKIPRRIISAVPSQTEFLYSIGLDDFVIGITKFCVHPNGWFRTKTRVGGTKTLNIEVIKSLKPDIVFANKEENEPEQIMDLQKICAVYTSDINNLQRAIEMMKDIGKLTGRIEKATEICNSAESLFQQLNPSKIIRAAYLIWSEPYMAVGGDTFINDMMQRCGFENIFRHEKRYPSVTLEQLCNMSCELLILSSEPFPFKQKHIALLQPLLPQTKIILADGEMFSWYGSRLIYAADYFKSLIAAL